MTSRKRQLAIQAISAVAIMVVAAAFTPALAGSNGKIRSLMLNAGVHPGARGAVHVVQNKAQVACQIKVSHLAANVAYDVVVDGAVVDQIRTNGEGAGKVVHRARLKGRRSGAALPYDPRGARVEIADGGAVLLSADVPASPLHDQDVLEIEFRLVNTGVVPEARARAEFKERDGRMRFEVKAKGLPVGVYDLVVDGAKVGEIVMEIEDDDDDCVGGTEGEVEFDSIPQACHDDGDDDEGEDGHEVESDDNDCGSVDQLLTFDPRGKSIEISQTDATLVVIVFFNGTFPATP